MTLIHYKKKKKHTEIVAKINLLNKCIHQLQRLNIIQYLLYDM